MTVPAEPQMTEGPRPGLLLTVWPVGQPCEAMME